MIRFTTETGSIYEIRGDEWMRVSETNLSGHVRTQRGKLTATPKIEIGSPVELWCPPIVNNADARVIYTSPVVRVEEMPDV